MSVISHDALLPQWHDSIGSYTEGIYWLGWDEGIEDSDLLKTQVPQNGGGEVEAASCPFPHLAPLLPQD